MDHTADRIIMGIDPGTSVLGYSMLQCPKNGTPRILALGVLKLNKFQDHYVRLRKIYERAVSLIDEFHPDELAIEAPFYAKNVQSMLKLGRAQGTVITVALSRSIPVFEYAPRKIKLAVTGKGAASKEQVARMLQTMFHMDGLPEYFDATDALAASVCHYFQKELPVPPASGTARRTTSHKGSWNDFVRNNPDRIVTT
ncbi:MAG: crossover junction endodeoxyribonuclease RuvC [Bacteroidales bacterium]|jgi:crossover junction endodeoxyribonuclease RuvC|nr:crossover junction endodeoxyribonuclease RuvC [Bacteroidales bacterium]MCR5713649.1 crossover junction endodeoxyribonuclease RuvC [Bacteroidales bacterium]